MTDNAGRITNVTIHLCYQMITSVIMWRHMLFSSNANIGTLMTDNVVGITNHVFICYANINEFIIQHKSNST